MQALALAIQLLQSLLTLAPLAQEVRDMYTNLTSALQDMQTTGRDPTQAEWDSMHAAIDAAVTALQ